VAPTSNLPQLPQHRRIGSAAVSWLQHGAAMLTASSTSRGRQMSILWIQPDTCEAMAASSALAADGWSLRFETCPAAAWRMAMRQPPAVVVIDTQSALVQAWQLMDIFRLVPALRRVHLVGLVAANDRRALHHDAARGAPRYVAKPVDASMLAQVVRRMAGPHPARRAFHPPPVRRYCA
jgi:CheY-like chemotaxis protein